MRKASLLQCYISCKVLVLSLSKIGIMSEYRQGKEYRVRIMQRPSVPVVGSESPLYVKMITYMYLKKTLC